MLPALWCVHTQFLSTTQLRPHFVFRQFKTHMSMVPTDFFYKHTASELEELEKYRSDGYCPVVLGDHLPRSSRRYRIVHKLAAGQFATVWLARDMLYDL
jgi:isopentenyl phosphate kinase